MTGMLSAKFNTRRRSDDPPEKPFWISFSDLMTALMVMFLLVMSVALLAVTKTVSEAETARQQREQDIRQLLDKIEQATRDFPGITVDRNRNVIDFGTRALFQTAKHSLTSEQQKLLREFVPRILEIARDELALRWLKRIVVEGFTDQRGTYLFNLNLSLQRSQRVLCALFARPEPNERPLTTGELEQIRTLFLVGGYSSNSAKASYDESRRIELRLEFLGVGESPQTTGDATAVGFGDCALEGS